MLKSLFQLSDAVKASAINAHALVRSGKTQVAGRRHRWYVKVEESAAMNGMTQAVTGKHVTSAEKFVHEKFDEAIIGNFKTVAI